jgi:hypothetical protein
LEPRRYVVPVSCARCGMHDPRYRYHPAYSTVATWTS